MILRLTFCAVALAVSRAAAAQEEDVFATKARSEALYHWTPLSAVPDIIRDGLKVPEWPMIDAWMGKGIYFSPSPRDWKDSVAVWYQEPVAPVVVRLKPQSKIFDLKNPIHIEKYLRWLVTIVPEAKVGRQSLDVADLRALAVWLSKRDATRWPVTPVVYQIPSPPLDLLRKAKGPIKGSSPWVNGVPPGQEMTSAPYVVTYLERFFEEHRIQGVRWEHQSMRGEFPEFVVRDPAIFESYLDRTGIIRAWMEGRAKMLEEQGAFTDKSLSEQFRARVEWLRRDIGFLHHWSGPDHVPVVPGRSGYEAEVARHLTSKHSDDRATATGYLGYLGVREFATNVAPLLRDPAPRVRGMAALTLGKLGAIEFLGGVQPLMGDSDPTVRLAAVRAVLDLTQGSSPAAWEVLRTDPEKEVRIVWPWIVKQLLDRGHLSTEQAIEKLSAASIDREQDVRERAARTLRSLYPEVERTNKVGLAASGTEGGNRPAGTLDVVRQGMSKKTTLPSMVSPAVIAAQGSAHRTMISAGQVRIRLADPRALRGASARLLRSGSRSMVLLDRTMPIEGQKVALHHELTHLSKPQATEAEVIRDEIRWAQSKGVERHSLARHFKNVDKMTDAQLQKETQQRWPELYAPNGGKIPILHPEGLAGHGVRGTLGFGAGVILKGGFDSIAHLDLNYLDHAVREVLTTEFGMAAGMFAGTSMAVDRALTKLKITGMRGAAGRLLAPVGVATIGLQALSGKIDAATAAKQTATLAVASLVTMPATKLVRIAVQRAIPRMIIGTAGGPVGWAAMGSLTAVDVALLLYGIDVIDPVMRKGFDFAQQALTTKSAVTHDYRAAHVKRN